MKNSLLQRRVFCAALFVLLLSVVGMKNAFAQTQVATLQHGDDISAYYGVNAFVAAHTAAADGDIITLSSGTFIPTTVTKAITLRGAGSTADTVAGTAPTTFASYMELNSANDSIPLIIEGILFSNDIRINILNNPRFLKCKFSTVSSLSSGSMQNGQFADCIIRNFSFFKTYNTVFINTVVWNTSSSNNNYPALCYNSIICESGQLFSVSAHNSIIIKRTAVSPPNNTCEFFNCIGVKIYNGYSPFGNGYTSNCVTYSSYEEIFESFNGEFSLDEPFILKEEIATSFFGSDGTQVGIYGGLMPYNPRPSYMVVQRCNVANKSTIDGKLSVDIEVVSEED